MSSTRRIWEREDIQAEYDVDVYEQMQRRLWEKGWMQTETLLKSGINTGHALELGCGPGYLGFDWLRNTEDTRLTGLDINEQFLARARENAHRLGLSDRARFVLGGGDTLPLPDAEVDGVFSNGSFHEWEKPVELLAEIHRVLKPGGVCVVTDHRRDMPWFAYWFMWFVTKPASIRRGLRKAIEASYTTEEVAKLLRDSPFGNAEASANPMGLAVVARKAE